MAWRAGGSQAEDGRPRPGTLGSLDLPLRDTAWQCSQGITEWAAEGMAEQPPQAHRGWRLCIPSEGVSLSFDPCFLPPGTFFCFRNDVKDSLALGLKLKPKSSTFSRVFSNRPSLNAKLQTPFPFTDWPSSTHCLLPEWTLAGTSSRAARPPGTRGAPGTRAH